MNNLSEQPMNVNGSSEIALRVRSGLEKAGFYAFVLFCLCVCISKAAINISGGLLFLMFIVYGCSFPREGLFRKNPWLLILLTPCVLGFIPSFFSLGGVKGAVAFLERYRFFLLILPYAAFIRTEKQHWVLFWALNVSGLIGVVYGVVHSDWKTIWDNFNGLHVVGRNSDLMFSIGLLNLTALIAFQWKHRPRNILVKLIIALCTLGLIAAVLVMQRRGSYVGCIVGLMALIVFSRKRLLISFLVFISATILYLTDSPVVARLKTIADLDGNISNAARLQLNKTGLDFLIKERLILRGTGGKMAEKPFVAFFKATTPDYQKQYNTVMTYAGNFHNSFLQMAAEGGAAFLAAYLASVLIMAWRMVWSLGNSDLNQRVYPVAALVVTSGFFVSQFFHNDLYSYGGIPCILVFSAGCSATHRYRESLRLQALSAFPDDED